MIDCWMAFLIEKFFIYLQKSSKHSGPPFSHLTKKEIGFWKTSFIMMFYGEKYHLDVLQTFQAHWHIKNFSHLLFLLSEVFITQFLYIWPYWSSPLGFCSDIPLSDSTLWALWISTMHLCFCFLILLYFCF